MKSSNMVGGLNSSIEILRRKILVCVLLLIMLATGSSIANEKSVLKESHRKVIDRKQQIAIKKQELQNHTRGLYQTRAPSAGSNGRLDDRMQVFSSRENANHSINNVLGHFLLMKNVDMAYGGFGGMRDSGYGYVSTTEPVTGTILYAFLYWSGPTNSSDPGANSEVNFAGNTIIGENIGFSHDNCWNYANSQAYRADVTSYITTGTGPYSLSNFVKGGVFHSSNAGQLWNVNINGASLIVFFDDGDSSNNHDYMVIDGNDSNVDNKYDENGWNVAINGINYTEGDATLYLHVADGQTFKDDSLYINNTTVTATDSIFQGNSIPFGASSEATKGGLWDIIPFDVTNYLSPGLNNILLSTGKRDDCLSLIVMLMELPVNSSPAEFNTGKISGINFFDFNTNGIKDDDEPGVSDWKIYLAGEVVDSVVTDPYGNYSFVNLPEGTYTVTEEMREGWTQTSPANPGYYTVTLDSLVNRIEKQDFGNRTPFAFSGHIWNDLNSNGIMDNGEPPKVDWGVELDVFLNTGGYEFYEAYTDSAGFYSVNGSSLGEYLLYPFFDDSVVVSSPENGFYYYNLTTSGDSITNADFGLRKIVYGAVSGYKFNDINNNGQWDGEEPGLPGWEINIGVGGSDFFQSAVTDSLGAFLFSDVPEGIHQVVEIPEEGWNQTFPPGGAYFLEISPDSSNYTNINFGNYLIPPHLSYDRSCITFGTVAPGETLSLPLTITNDGVIPVYLSGVSIGDTVFQYSSYPETLTAGQQKVLEITFVPPTTGEFENVLLISSNAGESKIPLYGQGELQSTGPEYEVFSGLVTIDGEIAPKYTFVGAFKNDRTFIKGSVIMISKEDIGDNVNYTLSLQVGQAGIQDGDTIIFAVGTINCDLKPELVCGKPTIFHPLISPSDEYTLKDIYAVSPATVSLSLHSGYNAVSWNVQPSSPEIASVFSPVLNSGKVKIILDYVNDSLSVPRYNFYIPDLGEYNSWQWTDFRKGYFILMDSLNEPVNMDIEGTPVCPSVPISLNSGYNFVSYLPSGRLTIETALQSIEDSLIIALDYVQNEGGGVFKFYPGGGFNFLDVGKGYFVNVTTPMDLIYPSGGDEEFSSHIKNKVSLERSFSVGDLPQAVFAYGKSITLNGVLVPKGTKINAVDHNGVICGSGTFAADGIVSLAIYADNPATSYDEGADIDEQVSLLINGEPVARRVQWTKFGDTPELDGELSVNGVTNAYDAPKQFALRQNFPNPFNPTTSIRFELANASFITLKIYDMLGQEVQSLVSENRKAGYHEVVWDGKNYLGEPVASGIYSYRLVVKSGEETRLFNKKMIFVK